MKKNSKNSGMVKLVFFFVLVAISMIGQVTAFAAVAPSLGVAATYGVLGSTYTNTSAGTTINGDVGFTTGPAVIPGGTHPNYGPGAMYAAAGADQGTALSSLSSELCTFTFGGGAINLSTDITHGPVGIYTPGVYCSAGAMDIGGPLTLSGSGTYIFRPLGALTSTAGAVITLTGASACDIFWTPTEATTLAANTTFFGTVIDDAGITVGANTTWTGKALAFGETVTTDTSTITVPICAPTTATLNVIKHVINDNIGTKNAGDFTLTIGGVTAVGGNTITGTEDPGITKILTTFGAYTVTETGLVGYLESSSADCSGTIAAGETKTCTITNNDNVPGSINVVKTVVNDNGGTKVVADFPLFVNGISVVSGATNVFPAPSTYTVTETSDSHYAQTFSGDCDLSGNLSLASGETKFCIITNNDIATSSGGGGGVVLLSSPVPPIIEVVKVPNPLALPDGPGLVKYTYTLRNIGTVNVSNITMVGDTCSPIVLISGDTDADNKLDVNETWVHTCSTTLTKTHTNTVVATGWANGISATDIASATVVVGLPGVVPPLIHVTKVPNPLTLPAGGGIVTYTKKVTNLGTIALSNISVTDDKCSPVNYISGDTNGDSKIDVTETWTYTCKENLTKTTTNIATVSGDANGMTARDFAIAHVVVAVPGLPNTGLFPKGESSPGDIAILASILMIVLTLFGVVILRKRRI